MRFTIRDLLWLMVVVGLAFGWWISLTKSRAEWHSEREQILVAWRKDNTRALDLHYRINTALSKLPAAERQELAHTIFGWNNKPTTPSGP
ncbi:MAG TPA: hypothetical protein VGI40_01845 [Pirellulaceae bacterium]|jgi:hypothetical protein